MPKTKVISARLPRSTESDFRSIAQIRGIRMNDLLNEVIADYLSQPTIASMTIESQGKN